MRYLPHQIIIEEDAQADRAFGFPVIGLLAYHLYRADSQMPPHLAFISRKNIARSCRSIDGNVASIRISRLLLSVVIKQSIIV